MQKELGIIGLGKMGANMARHMIEKGWRVIGYNRTSQVATDMEKEGLIVATTFEDVKRLLPAPRTVWLMVPAGEAVEAALFGPGGLAEILEPGDTIVDGGNSFYKDAAPRAEKLKAKGIRYMDCGTSGGPGGARNGACLMIGGDRQTFSDLESLYHDFAKEGAYQFFDGAGAGHFVKMVHNGIEYGMMQAIAEGFAVLKTSSFNLDLGRVTDIYGNGSVIESRLITWMKNAFEAHGQNLEGVSGSVKHTGEGAWTVQAAHELGIPVQVIEDSLNFRIASTDHPSYTGQLVAALREQFGGHNVK